MGEFKRGHVFLARLPDSKFEMNTLKDSPLISGERYVVILHDSVNQNYDERQVVVAPIVPKKEVLVNGTTLSTHILLTKTEFNFLDDDSLVCTHQILPINRDWLQNKKVEDLSNTRYSYKIDLGIIDSAGLSNLVEELVKDEAEKLELEYAKPDIQSHSSTPTLTRNFTRGDVFYSQLPKQEYTNGTFPPSFTIQGEHMVVVLHDSVNTNFDNSQVLVTPITSAKATVRNGKLLPTHVELSPSEFTYIKRKSFVSTHQIVPINKDWLDPAPKGVMTTAKMLEIDLAIVIAGDLSISINKRVIKRITQLREEALKNTLRKEVPGEND